MRWLRLHAVAALRRLRHGAFLWLRRLCSRSSLPIAVVRGGRIHLAVIISATSLRRTRNGARFCCRLFDQPAFAGTSHRGLGCTRRIVLITASFYRTRHRATRRWLRRLGRLHGLLVALRRTRHEASSGGAGPIGFLVRTTTVVRSAFILAAAIVLPSGFSRNRHFAIDADVGIRLPWLRHAGVARRVLLSAMQALVPGLRPQLTAMQAFVFVLGTSRLMRNLSADLLLGIPVKRTPRVAGEFLLLSFKWHRARRRRYMRNYRATRFHDARRRHHRGTSGMCSEYALSFRCDRWRDRYGNVP